MTGKGWLSSHSANEEDTAMSIIGIHGVGTELAGTSAPAVADSSAHRAYRAAVKDLSEAKSKLNDDSTSKAATEILEADRMAIQMAQAALADAAAALAREAERMRVAQAAEAREATKKPAATDPVEPAANRKAPRPHGVDLYA